MKLYEINAQLEELLARLEPDPETGEIPADEDQIIEEFNALNMERYEILQYITKEVLNARAEAAAVKEEEQRLKTRRTRLEMRQDRLLAILDRECGGQKTDLGVATLSYRKTSRLELRDPDETARWLQDNGYTECIRVKAPEVAKTEVTKLINLGVEVPGAEIIKTISYSLK